MSGLISDRVAVKELCQTTLAAHMLATSGFENVTVHYGDPGENYTDQMVILGDITGRSEAVAFGTAGRDDTFTIRAGVLAHGFASALDSDRRCQDILDQVNAVLFEQRFAASLQARVYPGDWEGPNPTAPLDGHAASSVAEFDINVTIGVRGA
jgi:hypothetical protein